MRDSPGVGGSFIIVGERTNVSGSAKFRKLISQEDYNTAVAIARDQINGGAQILDINLDDGLIDGVAAMRKYIRLLAAEPDIANCPVMIDSSDFEVIVSGLENTQGKSIVNSISLKEGEKHLLEQAEVVRSFGAATVVMAFDEEGQAETAERKLAIARRTYRLLTEKINFPPQDIIFDLNIFAIATGISEHDNYALDFLQAAKQLRAEFPQCHISGGVSNISFALRGNDYVRQAMHAIFLFHAIRHGMSMALVNAGRIPIYSDIELKLKQAIEDVIFNRHAAGAERLLELAMQFRTRSGKSGAVIDDSWRHKPVAERLPYALVHGIDSFIVADVEQAYQEFGSALQVIDQPLMSGMNQVGDLFASGQMFLPQVVKSARVMKKAVDILTPKLSEEKSLGKSKSQQPQGKILLATVKGDVHDIGKNIVAVVLRCSGIDIVDLGVMVPAAKILEQAVANRVDIIGLSGLITPSLTEMSNIAEQLQKGGFTQPLLIGGATTSKAHTALRIEPNYQNGVVHVVDAARASKVVQQLLSKRDRTKFLAETASDYDKVRRQYQGKHRELVSYQQACNNCYQLDIAEYPPVIPQFLGSKLLTAYPVSQLISRIDWHPFFQAWEFKGRYPEILHDSKQGAAARSLFNDAKKLLSTMQLEKWLNAKAAFGFWPASKIGESIQLYSPDDQRRPITRLDFLRQQMPRSRGKVNLSLADFVAAKATGVQDYIGMFAVTTGVEVEQRIERLKNQQEEYQTILAQALLDRLVEALAEHLHERVRKEFWGYAKDEQLTNEQIIKEQYQGIRPAPGYPACPDHYEKSKLLTLIDPTQATGIVATESFALKPAASIVGYYFAHPAAQYFGLGQIGQDQLAAYAKLQGRELADLKNTIAGQYP